MRKWKGPELHPLDKKGPIQATDRPEAHKERVVLTRLQSFDCCIAEDARHVP